MQCLVTVKGKVTGKFRKKYIENVIADDVVLKNKIK